MRYEISNPYSDKFGEHLVSLINRAGLFFYAEAPLSGYVREPSYAVACSRQRVRLVRRLQDIDRIVHTMRYDALRHVFYFSDDVSFRRMYYNATSPILRSFVGFIEGMMPLMCMCL